MPLQSHPEPQPATGFVCGEVRGGNDLIHERVELPGLRGVLYSRPCHGPRGGDIHYLSVCGSGLIARVFVADVAGHGGTIAAVGTEMHAHLRRSVDTADDRKVLTRLDRRLAEARLDTMATAAIATYYPPARRLTVGYAGHPPGWLYRSHDRRWSRLDGPAGTGTPRLCDLPLGTPLGPAYTRRRFQMADGDRVLLVTDGVLEAPGANGEEFGVPGLETVLHRHDGNIETLGRELLDALHGHVGGQDLSHDDVTFFVGEIVPGPPGPALWHVVRNRLLARFAGPGPAASRA